MRLNHQGRVLGFDFNAAFALAEAMGVNKIAVAEFLPSIEGVAASRINEHLRALEGE